MGSANTDGLVGPALSTPHRAAPSSRRTSSIDTTWPDGLGGLLLHQGRARDLVTGADGEAAVVAEATLQARVDGRTHQLLALEVTPAVAGLDDLLGSVVGPGFRGRVSQLLPEEAEASSPLFLLLDDLPAASLVSGYALLYAGAMAPRETPTDGMSAQADLCSGWASDGTMMVALRTTGSMAVPYGPPAPTLERNDDPIGWHPMAPLPPISMRRRRRLDVMPSESTDCYRAEVFFRDTHVDATGSETVVHEYQLGAEVDERSNTIRHIEAAAGALPWTECPAALGSAQRLEGRGLGDLRLWVRRNLVGTSTCTHLNDTLRGLTDLEALIALVPPAFPAVRGAIDRRSDPR